DGAGGVVMAVAEYVDVGVVPGDVLAVHPDPLRLLHCSSLLAVRAKYASRLRALQADSPDYGVGHVLRADRLLVRRGQVRRSQSSLERRVHAGLDRAGLGVHAQSVAEAPRRRK